MKIDTQEILNKYYSEFFERNIFKNVALNKIVFNCYTDDEK